MSEETINFDGSYIFDRQIDSLSEFHGSASTTYQKNAEYLFIFIKETSFVETNGSMDISYLMDESYDLVDRLRSLVPQQNGNNIAFIKQWLDGECLESFLENLKNVNTETQISSVYDDEDSQMPSIYTPSQTELVFNDSESCKQIIAYRRFFVLGSFHTDNFTKLQKASQSIISPLTIQYWYHLGLMNNQSNSPGQPFNLNEHLFNPRTAVQPLFSLCMKDMIIYMSKSIPLKHLVHLCELIQFMGGSVANELDLDVTIAVVEAINTKADSGSQKAVVESSDNKINAAKFFEIPIVKVDWIQKAWSQLQLQFKFASDKDFVRSQLCQNLRPEIRLILESLTIAIITSVYDNLDDVLQITFGRIKSLILRFGGTVVSSSKQFNFYCSNLILHVVDPFKDSSGNISMQDKNKIHEQLLNKYEQDQSYRRLNEKRCLNDGPIPIVTVDWLFKTIIERKIQPFDQYQI